MKASSALVKLSLLCSGIISGLSLYALDHNVSASGAADGLYGERSDGAYLSSLKREAFEYDYRKSEEEGAKLRDSWIRAVELRYGYSKSDPYDNKQTQESAAIVLDQPIFQSGGIYAGIKFAEASRRYADYSIDQQRRLLVKESVALLMQIHQSEMMIRRQELRIANAQINLEQKREQYLNGQLDSGFLNSAVIEKNVVVQALYDLQTGKERLVSKFQSISDLDYRTTRPPRLALLSEDAFMAYSIDMKKLHSQRERDRYNSYVTLAKYLPKLSVTAGYNWQKQDKVSYGGGSGTSTAETHYYNYGFQASMPFDINSYNDYESKRMDYLKSQVMLDDKKRELRSLFEQVRQNIENYERKIALSRENRELYGSLLHDTLKLYDAGYKTAYDVDMLKNSQEIEAVNIQIYEYDKQLELLNLYEKTGNEIQ